MIVASAFDPISGKFTRYEYRFVPLNYVLKDDELPVTEAEAACISYAFPPGDDDGPSTVNTTCIKRVKTMTRKDHQC